MVAGTRGAQVVSACIHDAPRGRGQGILRRHSQRWLRLRQPMGRRDTGTGGGEGSVFVAVEGDGVAIMVAMWAA